MPAADNQILVHRHPPLCISRYRDFTAIAMVTFIWGIWHFPLLFQGIAFVYPWIFILVSVSIILTWLWIKTNGNLFVLALAHASANASQAFFENRLIEKKIAKEHLLAGWEILGYGYLFVALIILLIDFKSFRDDHNPISKSLPPPFIPAADPKYSSNIQYHSQPHTRGLLYRQRGNQH
ncbi:MAG: CPBP family intramembrane glutamic endopeptidase [Bacteroidota bacterium]